MPILTISYMTNVSHSTYHSGTVHVQKRLANDLLYDSFFTYSKSMMEAASVPLFWLLIFSRTVELRQAVRYAGNFSYNSVRKASAS